METRGGGVPGHALLAHCMVGREMKRPATFPYCWPGVNPDCSMARNSDRLSAPLSLFEGRET